MLRFIALIWDPASPDATAASKRLYQHFQAGEGEWRAPITAPGLAVLCAGENGRSTRSYKLPSGRGVVLGTLFPRGRDETRVGPAPDFTQADERAMFATQGEHLISHYWGRYVCFLADTPRSALVIRDPLGCMPCYFTARDGVHVAFSCLEDCHQIRPELSVDWTYVAAHLMSDASLESIETALEEVWSVRPGECVTLAPTCVSRSFYWHPQEIVSTNIIESADDAESCLRETVRADVRAWASCHDTILHRLSGGLDSAIVLACLAGTDAQERLTCLNYFSADSDGDERRYARLAAAKAGARLIEQKRNGHVDLSIVLRMAKSPRPAGYVYSADHGRLEAHWAERVGATAVFSGEMGDSLFYQGPALPAAADYVWRNGLRWSALQVALDVARVAHVSLWRVLWDAMRDGMLPNRPWHAGTDLTMYRTVVADGVRHDTSLPARFAHPWLSAANHIPPGKCWQLYCMAMTPYPFYNPLASPGDPDRITPLVSQPTVEACLRIPTYLQLRDGWSRAAARRAFAGHIPDEIAMRRTKGGMEEHVKSIFSANIPFIRELLLDGHLVAHGLLDRRRLEDVMAVPDGKPSTIRSPMSELLWYVCTEAWLQAGWRSNRQQEL